MDDDQIGKFANKLLLAELTRQGVISFGKTAELAGVGKMEFITEMGRMGVPYFYGDVSDVMGDAETVRKTMAGAAQ